MINDVRCIVCNHEYNIANARSKGVSGCPKCATVINAMPIPHDGYIKVNWEEIRMLALFAQRWTSLFDRTNQGNKDTKRAIERICKKLEERKPKTGYTLIEETMKDESVISPLQIGDI